MSSLPSASSSSSAGILESYINAVKFRDASFLASSKSQEEEERRRTKESTRHSEINSRVARSKGDTEVEEWELREKDHDQLRFRIPVVEGEISRRRRSKERLEIVLNCVKVSFSLVLQLCMHKQGKGSLMISFAWYGVTAQIDGRLLVLFAVGFNLIRFSLKLLSTIVCSQLLRLVRA